MLRRRCNCNPRVLPSHAPTCPQKTEAAPPTRRQKPNSFHNTIPRWPGDFVRSHSIHQRLRFGHEHDVGTRQDVSVRFPLLRLPEDPSHGI